MNRILAILAAIVSAFLYSIGIRNKVKEAEYRQKQAESTIEITNKATKALIHGVTNEQENFNSDNRPNFDPNRKL